MPAQVLRLNQSGRYYKLTTYILGFVIISARLDVAANTSEAFDILRTSLDIALFLVCIYMFAVEMIINFLIKRGRLR